MSDAVVDVERLLLKLELDVERDGYEWKAKCPTGSHQDNNPSWSIVDQPGAEKHGVHRCWSCKWSGNAFTLVAFMLDISIRSVDAWLEREGLYVGGSSLPLGVELDSKRKLEFTFRLPLGVVFGPLARWVTPARRYAAGRGLTEAQVERWGIGYAVVGELAGRIVMPVRSEAGVVGSYMARTFVGARARYKSPEEGSGAEPSAVFGAEGWLGRRGELYLAEGAINALALERAGAKLVAALGGSRLTPEAAGLMAEHERLVLVFDPDQAGEGVAAQVRGALGRWKEIREVWLPSGKDAADLSETELRRHLSGARLAKRA